MNSKHPTVCVAQRDAVASETSHHCNAGHHESVVDGPNVHLPLDLAAGVDNAQGRECTWAQGL